MDPGALWGSKALRRAAVFERGAALAPGPQGQRLGKLLGRAQGGGAALHLPGSGHSSQARRRGTTRSQYWDFLINQGMGF